MVGGEKTKSNGHELDMGRSAAGSKDVFYRRDSEENLLLRERANDGYFQMPSLGKSQLRLSFARA